MLAICAVQQEIKSVAARLADQFAFAAFKICVEQNRRLRRIPVMDIMRRGLEVPGQFPRIRVQRNNCAGIKVIAWPPSPASTGFGFPIPQ